MVGIINGCHNLVLYLLSPLYYRDFGYLQRLLIESNPYCREIGTDGNRLGVCVDVCECPSVTHWTLRSCLLVFLHSLLSLPHSDGWSTQLLKEIALNVQNQTAGSCAAMCSHPSSMAAWSGDGGQRKRRSKADSRGTSVYTKGEGNIWGHIEALDFWVLFAWVTE